MDVEFYKKYEPIFGFWYIKDLIGEGSYGDVYLIEREELGITYRSALKVVTIPNNSNELKNVQTDGLTEADVRNYYKTMVENIASEFILMSKLKGHSNIVSYEDHMIIEHADDIGWDILIRMELLTPLVDIMANESLSEQETVKLGIDMCRALEFCGKYGIVHRDIKPGNIFISPSGDYKIGDFGIAKTIDKTTSNLSNKGTNLYMAPEAYRGDHYGATVDIYSVGLVLYKLLNNNRTPFMPPYPASVSYIEREESLSRRMRGDKIEPPCNASPELQRIVLKACEYDPADRYAKALEMRKDLQLYLYQKYLIKDESSSQSIKTKAKKQETKIKPAHKEHRPSNPRLAIRIVAACLIIAAVIIAPKSVTAINGIDDNIRILIGETYTPDLRIHPFYLAGTKLEYSVSDKDVIRAEEGTISALSVGNAKYTITGGDYSRTVKVSVEPKVTGITGIQDFYYVEKGKEMTLTPSLEPEEYANEKISYRSSDEGIVRVDAKGKVTAISGGKAKIVISAGGYEKTVEVTVTEPKVVYHPTSNTGKKSNPGKTTKKTSGKTEYFDSSEDEFF